MQRPGYQPAFICVGGFVSPPQYTDAAYPALPYKACRGPVSLFKLCAGMRWCAVAAYGEVRGAGSLCQ